MRIDDLTRELQAQAEETRSWPMPAAPSPVRIRHHRRQAVLVLVSAVAVAAIVGLPQLLDRDTTSGLPATGRPSAASSPTTVPQWHEWTALRCPSRTRHTCAVPWILQVHAGRYSSGTGARQPVVEGTVTSRDLKVRLHGPPRGRLVLVGAIRPGPHSRLMARIGDADPVRVEEHLALLWLPRSRGPIDVWVTEEGVPAHQESLVIEEYRPVENTGG
ncbi:hypothetical protein [Marmoricola sp. URHB0036]|uniref:hypothetical protein n=1 Tax=Marmoricola sp. URHB0036 TaxID=1298863 RepID=UPI0003FA1C94|nr:hypothetical protein [Marmoricola sp. URHB0036]